MIDEESLTFLRRSLTDLDAELAAGDLDPEDHARLRDEYTTRLARALRDEPAPPDGPPAGPHGPSAGPERFDVDSPQQEQPAPGSTRSDGGGRGGGATRSPWLRPAAWALFVVALALGAGMLVARSSGSRTSGQALTGEIREPSASQLDQCLELSQGTDVVGAVKCYDAVLKDQPSSVEALTYRAWTLVRTGAPALLPAASANLDQAVALDPAYADARVFRAVVRRDQGRLDDARADLAAFDALNAPELMRNLVDQMGLRDSLR